MKIYIASSWKNPYQPRVVEELRRLGHNVYDFRNPKENNKGFHWSEIDPLWEYWTPEEYKQGLLHPIAESGFKLDFDAMNWADCCVMVLPCGRSANTEAGWMKGKGKPVYVFMPIAQEPELMYKIYNEILTDLDQLQSLKSQPESVVKEDKEKITAEEFYTKKNGGKTPLDSTIDNEFITPIYACILMEEFASLSQEFQNDVKQAKYDIKAETLEKTIQKQAKLIRLQHHYVNEIPKSDYDEMEKLQSELSELQKSKI